MKKSKCLNFIIASAAMVLGVGGAHAQAGPAVTQLISVNCGLDGLDGVRTADFISGQDNKGSVDLIRSNGGRGGSFGGTRNSGSFGRGTENRGNENRGSFGRGDENRGNENHGSFGHGDENRGGDRGGNLHGTPLPNGRRGGSAWNPPAGRGWEGAPRGWAPYGGWRGNGWGYRGDHIFWWGWMDLAIFSGIGYANCFSYYNAAYNNCNNSCSVESNICQSAPVDPNLAQANCAGLVGDPMYSACIANQTRKLESQKAANCSNAYANCSYGCRVEEQGAWGMAPVCGAFPVAWYPRPVVLIVP